MLVSFFYSVWFYLALFLSGSGVVLCLKDKRQYSIGRSKQADLCLTTLSISKEHGFIWHSSHCIEIEDVSSHGIFVNGKPIPKNARLKLKEYDKIRFATSDTYILKKNQIQQKLLKFFTKIVAKKDKNNNSNDESGAAPAGKTKKKTKNLFSIFFLYSIFIRTKYQQANAPSQIQAVLHCLNEKRSWATMHLQQFHQNVMRESWQLLIVQVAAFFLIIYISFC